MTSKPWVTFDCYGTLVTWDGGLREAFGGILGLPADSAEIGDLLAAFKPVQHAMMQSAYRPLKEIMPDALRAAMGQRSIEYRPTYGTALMSAVSKFGPFPEVPDALNKVRDGYRIAIISNSDDDIIDGNVKAIGVPFDAVITAQQARGYKPGHAIFNQALSAIGATADAIVHVAAGFLYDIAPASELGYRRIWINRAGSAGNSAFAPYGELPDLSGLPDLLEGMR